MTTHITKTWFDGEKVVTQEISEADFYKPSMTKEQEALKLALEALEKSTKYFNIVRLGESRLKDTEIRGASHKAITAIKDALAQSEERNFCQRCGKRTQDIHTCTPPIAAGSQAFYGFPNEPVSTPNAGGKCVTAGETAPVKEIDPNQWAFDRGLEST
jgi:hypothetical protein